MLNANKLYEYTAKRVETLQREIEVNYDLFDKKKINFNDYHIANIILNKERDYLTTIKELLYEVK